MKKHVVLFSFLIFFLLLLSPVGAATIKVMTQNQYLGADLIPIFAASDAVEFNAAVVAALQTVAANKPADRMKALAAEVAKEKPDLVGLQEVFEFQCIDLVQPPIPEHGCSDPSIAAAVSDHLQATLDALNGAYVNKGTVVNLNIPIIPNISGIPFEVNGVPALLGVIDRDVILVRRGINATLVDYRAFQSLGVCVIPSGDGCNFSAALPAPTPLGTINVEHGFVAVDVKIDGKAYRLVNTHLEQQRPDPSNPLSQLYQIFQAAELLYALQNTTPMDRSLIVVGDMNSGPEHPAIAGYPTPYQQFVAAGFTDAWTLRPGGLPGYTCCQLEDLSNRRSVLYERIDIIFSYDVPSNVKKARIVGATVSDKTPPPGRGLWPSDHASVTADLQFQLLTAKK